MRRVISYRPTGGGLQKNSQDALPTSVRLSRGEKARMSLLNASVTDRRRREASGVRAVRYANGPLPIKVQVRDLTVSQLSGISPMGTGASRETCEPR